MRAVRETPVHREPDEGSERVTTLALGEEVVVVATEDAWTRVLAPDQPSSLDPAGYPGWVPTATLGATPLDVARGQLGAAYVWGGLDCSGLVHLAFRACGVRVPRDAADQAAAAVPVSEPEPGDLWFFGRYGEPVGHVGFVTEVGLLHATEGRGVVEEPVPAERRETLLGAGRLG